jgi:hypothetical protein
MLLHDSPLHFDFVIIARKPSREAGLNDFMLDIKKILKKLAHEKGTDSTDKAL